MQKIMKILLILLISPTTSYSADIMGKYGCILQDQFMPVVKNDKTTMYKYEEGFSKPGDKLTFKFWAEYNQDLGEDTINFQFYDEAVSKKHDGLSYYGSYFPLSSLNSDKTYNFAYKFEIHNTLETNFPVPDFHGATINERGEIRLYSGYKWETLRLSDDSKKSGTISGIYVSLGSDVNDYPILSFIKCEEGFGHTLSDLYSYISKKI